MIGVYFSGTGNSRYCLERFLQEYDVGARAFSIEDNHVMDAVSKQDEIVFAYPVQYSNIPKILKDFVLEHQQLWYGKKVFVIATMALFSGDGSGILARLLQKYGAEILGGLHLKMPDSIGDEKVLKRPLAVNQKIVADAVIKIKRAVALMKSGSPPQEGIGIFYRVAGLLGQRLYFINKTQHYTNKIKIHRLMCIGCGKCMRLCPMNNLTLDRGIAVPGDRCTMCYRCVNHCPKQAITLLGKRVVEQSYIEKYT